jgi:hypothetical protein
MITALRFTALSAETKAALQGIGVYFFVSRKN